VRGVEARFMNKVLKLSEQEVEDAIAVALELQGYEGAPSVTFVMTQKGELVTFVDGVALAETEDQEEPTPEEDQGLKFSRIVEAVSNALVRRGLEGDLDEVTDFVARTLQDDGDVEIGSRADFKLLVQEIRERVSEALHHLEGEGRAEIVTDEHEDDYWQAVRKPAKGKKKVAVRPAVAQRDMKDAVSGEMIPGGTDVVFVEDLGSTVVHPKEWPEELREKFEGRIPTGGPFKMLEPATEASTAADILGSEGGVLDRSEALGQGVSGEGRRPSRRKNGRRGKR
jgi:hypothetical protein